MTATCLVINIPLDELAKQLSPHVEAKVEAIIASGRTRKRSEIDSLDAAITTVIKAISRVENSAGTRDDKAAMTALVSAAVGLRTARINYRKGI